MSIAGLDKGILTGFDPFPGDPALVVGQIAASALLRSPSMTTSEEPTYGLRSGLRNRDGRKTRFSIRDVENSESEQDAEYDEARPCLTLSSFAPTHLYYFFAVFISSYHS